MIAVNVVTINISPHFTAFLTKNYRKIHRISYKYSALHFFPQINVRNAVKAVNAVKKYNSSNYTAFLTQIHRKIHRISYKYSALHFFRQIIVRKALKAVNAVKKIIHRTSPLFLPKFTARFTTYAFQHLLNLI